MEMTTAKTIAVFAIIVGCFAVLYPKIFHPMLLHAFGASPDKNTDTMSQMPPHLRRPGPGGRGAGPGQPDDFAQHMRGGPHPGLRAAAEMKKQAGTTTGSGKGMMSVVLPMYAVGIVLYLIYTMTKVFGKGDKKEEDKDYMSSHFKDGEGKGGKKRLVVDDDAMKRETPQDNRKRQKDLERLLMKADKDKITELEMQQLKQRLLETEAQMTRILQAMETVAEKVEGQTADVPPQQSPPEEAASKEKDPQIRPTKLQDNSPDLDSYDFVRHSSAEQSPVMVEDIHCAKEQDSKDDKADLRDNDCTSDQDDHHDDLDDVDDDDDDDDEEGMRYTDEDIDEVELDYDQSPAEDIDDDECEDDPEGNTEEVIIGQNKEEEPQEEEHPDLRKRRPPSNQKRKVQKAD